MMPTFPVWLWRVLAPGIHVASMQWERLGPLAIGALLLPNWWLRVLSHPPGLFEGIAIWVTTLISIGYAFYPYSENRLEAKRQLQSQTALGLLVAPLGIWLSLRQEAPLLVGYWTSVFLLALSFRASPQRKKEEPLRWARVEEPKQAGEARPKGEAAPKDTAPTPPPPAPTDSSFLVYQPKLTPAQSPEEARLRLQEKIYLPKEAEEEVVRLLFLLKEFRSFQRVWGLEPPSAILLVGPPGTGKTSVARFLAEASGFPLVAANPGMLRSKWYGESERLIRELFATARQLSPAIVYLDEVESLAPTRDAAHEATASSVAQLLQEIDGIQTKEKPTFLLASTNLPERIDPALLSRFSATVTLPLPNLEGRMHILKLLLKEQGKYLDLDLIAQHTQGFSGRDLKTLVQRAATQALLEGRHYLTEDDLLREIATAKKLRK